MTAPERQLPTRKSSPERPDPVSHLLKGNALNRLSLHSAVAALVVPAAAVAAVAIAGAAPASASAASRPVVTGVHTVASFDYATGQQPESVTVNPDRSLTVSMLGFFTGSPGELLHVSPSGQQTVLVTGNAGEAISGNVRGHDGSIYYNMISADPARSGIWRIPPGGAPERIAATPGAFLNGLTIDPVTQTLYSCDSQTGTIWSVPASGGTATQWLTSPTLAPAQSGPGHIGANGVEFHQGAVWVSNTDKGTLLRIPVTPAGAPGPVQVAASGLPSIDDFKFLSARSGIVFAALNGQDEVAVVYPDGRSRVALTAADGLAFPSDTYISGNRLYIADSGRLAPHDSKLQEARIDLGALYAGPGNE